MPDQTSTTFPAVISVAISGNLVPTANARDLHAFLQVGRDFTTWIKGRLDQYGFEAGADYVVESAPPIRGAGNRGAREEYHLTLDVAKELAMVENNDRGRQVRQYFIAAERRAKAAMPSLPASLPEALRLAADLAEQLDGQRARVGVLAPKAEALDRLGAAGGSVCVTDAAKALKVPPRELFTYLRGNGWLYRRPGTDHDVGYQARVDTGMLEHTATTFTGRSGTSRVTTQVRVTPKGLAELAKALQREAAVLG